MQLVKANIEMQRNGVENSGKIHYNTEDHCLPQDYVHLPHLLRCLSDAILIFPFISILFQNQYRCNQTVRFLSQLIQH